MTEPLISVIVPVYRIERYLGICIESILDQTYQNIELILVDDGSPDRCPEICDLYASKDSRITVIHKQNDGLVSARKAGLLASHGEYIGVVDGDDRIGRGFYMSLYSSISESGADVAIAGFSRDLFDKSQVILNTLPSGTYEGESLVGLYRQMLSCGKFHSYGITTYLWNKLFRRECILQSQLNVDNGISIGEDAAAVYPALLKCSKICITDNCAYHYRQREDSMLKQSSNYAEEAQILSYLYEYMKKWSESAPKELGIKKQVTDHVLSMAVIRSGGRLPHMDYSTIEKRFCGKNVVLYSAGTFGQQVYTRFLENNYCNVVAWIDSYYVEYRRCCRDVDPVEAVCSADYEYVLIASVDSAQTADIVLQLEDLGVERKKILTVEIPEENREKLLENFLDVEAIREKACLV